MNKTVSGEDNTIRLCDHVGIFTYDAERIYIYSAKNT